MMMLLLATVLLGEPAAASPVTAAPPAGFTRNADGLIHAQSGVACPALLDIPGSLMVRSGAETRGAVGVCRYSGFEGDKKEVVRVVMAISPFPKPAGVSDAAASAFIGGKMAADAGVPNAQTIAPETYAGDRPNGAHKREQFAGRLRGAHLLAFRGGSDSAREPAVIEAIARLSAPAAQTSTPGKP